MFKKIGLLWAKRDKNGKQYLDGFINGGAGFGRTPKRKTKVVIYANDTKLTEASPDFYIYLKIKNKKEAKDGGNGGNGNAASTGDPGSEGSTRT